MKEIDCLDLYSDGLEYDLINQELNSDILFYLKQIQRVGDPVLELACGTGRIAIRLAEAGYDVTGIDISQSMLRWAQKKAEKSRRKIAFYCGDIRSFYIKKRYNLIIFPFNSIAHLHEFAEISESFNCARQHLSNSGIFVTDYFNPNLNVLLRDPNKRYPVTAYFDPVKLQKITVTENNIYDSASQVNFINWYFMNESTCQERIKKLNMRIIYPQEMEALLVHAGFTVFAKYGDYNEAAFAANSSKQIIICKRNG
jgi:SAM-dependent methyltransferase